LVILKEKFNYNIPVYWIWDLLDEFIYQFQTFSQERSKMPSDDQRLEHFIELHE
jgi:hypothetical protein